MRAILTYHSIDRSGSVISVDPADFRRHVEWLAGSGVTVVGLSDLTGSDREGGTVSLTFDDGFANFATEAWPVLEGSGMPATLFVTTGCVGGMNAWESGSKRIPALPLLDWPTLGRLAERGVTLGSHSITHADLRHVPQDALEEEVEASAERIREETGVEPSQFAYPYGGLDERVAHAVRARYGFAVTTEFREVREGDDAVRLPRLDAWYLRRPGRLERFGTRSFARFIAVRRQLRGVRRFFVEGKAS